MQIRVTVYKKPRRCGWLAYTLVVSKVSNAGSCPWGRWRVSSFPSNLHTG